MLKVKIYRFVIRLMALILWRKKAPTNLTVKLETIPVDGDSIGVRIYTPQGSGPFPMILYFHGGGFVIGDTKSYDPMCRDLCAKSQHIVISVDYRLAPEHPFPAAPLDCMASLKWTTDNSKRLNGIKEQIITAGDSAGGNLATVVALQSREKFPGLIKGQLLIYPVTHHYSYNTVSYNEKGKGYGLTRDMMIWFWDLYYRDNDLVQAGKFEHELATPLALDDLSNLPPALIITAENDPLRDEGIEYAERLSEQGIKVQHTLYSGAEHGFIGSLGPSAEHDKGMQEIAHWLNNLPQVETIKS